MDPSGGVRWGEGKGNKGMNFNLAVTLRETALASPGRPAILYPGGSLTYAELDGLPAGVRSASPCDYEGSRP